MVLRPLLEAAAHVVSGEAAGEAKAANGGHPSEGAPTARKAVRIEMYSRKHILLEVHVPRKRSSHICKVMNDMILF